MRLPAELEGIITLLRDNGIRYIITDEEGLIIDTTMNEKSKEIAGFVSTIVKQINDMLGQLIPNYYSIKIEDKRIYVIRKKGFLIIIEK